MISVCFHVTDIPIIMQAISVTKCEPPYIGRMPGGRPPNSNERTEFGQRLLEARTNKGLSQTQLAKLLGVTQPSYADWERKAMALRPEHLAKLSEILEVPVSVLVGIEEEAKKNGGPVGRARRVFEVVSELPRSQQTKILDTVETLIAGHSAQKS